MGPSFMKLTFKFERGTYGNMQINKCNRQFQIVISVVKVMK